MAIARDRHAKAGRLKLAASALTLSASVYFSYRALRFFTFDPEALGKYFPYKWIIMGHVAGGILALLSGPFQLSSTFRNRHRYLHRILGRVYVSATSVGAACALILATITAPRVSMAYALSLHMLACVWLASGLLSFLTAARKRFEQHRQWAVRSYITTLAFVAQSLLLEVPFVTALGTFAETAATLIWFSWTVPLFAYDGLRTIDRRSVQTVGARD